MTIKRWAHFISNKPKGIMAGGVGAGFMCDRYMLFECKRMRKTNSIYYGKRDANCKGP